MENPTQLVYEISGKKYVLFEMTLVNDYQTQRMKTKIRAYEGIIQSIKKTSDFWNGTKVECKVLIPEERALFFSQS